MPLYIVVAFGQKKDQKNFKEKLSPFSPTYPQIILSYPQKLTNFMFREP